MRVLNYTFRLQQKLQEKVGPAPALSAVEGWDSPNLSLSGFSLTTAFQNQSLRYAIHQLAYRIGIVAANAHHSGNRKSASRPSTVKLIQKTFRSIPRFYSRRYLPHPRHVY